MIEKIPKWSAGIKNETQIEFYISILIRYGIFFLLAFVVLIDLIVVSNEGWGIGGIILSIVLASLLFFFMYVAIRNKPILIINEQGVWTKYSDLISWNDFEADSITYDFESGTEISFRKKEKKRRVSLWLGITDIRLKQIAETYRQRGAAETVRLLRTL